MVDTGGEVKFIGGFSIDHLGGVVLPDQFGTSTHRLNAQRNLQARGAEAWNKLRPDAPDFTLLSSLYELKDLPGMFKQAVEVIRDRTRLASGRSSMSYTGEYYLSIQFGWLPLYGDIRNFIKAHRASQKRVSQLIRDAGKPVRRRAQLSDSALAEASTSSVSFSGAQNTSMSPVGTSALYQGGKASTTTRKTYESRTWAMGSFRYILPPGPHDVAWKKKMYRRIMGGRLSPSQIYAIIPWSWLVDYFTDLGQFISAISPGVTDRLIADYAYLMRTESSNMNTVGEQYVTTGSRSVGTANSTGRATATCVTTYVTKIRVVASPFGFGVKQGSLTPRQVAIMGAIGLSRLP